MPKFKKKLQQMLYWIEPERAHRLALSAIKMLPQKPFEALPDPLLSQRIWGMDFINPLGVAAGFDKNAEVPQHMHRFGFAFAEIGTVTPLPQPGNPRPRLFRLREDHAVINRLGFNNQGQEAVKMRLEALRARGIALSPIGVNIGMNKDAEDPVGEYRKGVLSMIALSDYLTVNISSPNTPGLRNLQQTEIFEKLIDGVLDARAQSGFSRPILFKIAPDLDAAQIAAIGKLALDKSVDGLIVSNTTIARPKELESPHHKEQGGLSGRPLFRPSTRVLRAFCRATEGKITLVGAGGIASGFDAYRKIKAGASLLQLYSAIVYSGPSIARTITQELGYYLRQDGFAHVGQAVGVEADEKFDETMY